MREITFDLETTGLEPVDGHRIVEIGCVELVDKKRTGNSFHRYVNPDREMPKEAEKVHGLSNEFLSNKPFFKEVVSDFLEFVGEDTLVIHNAAFDMKFINYELKQLRKLPLSKNPVIDTLALARKKFPGSKVNLDALCTRFGIDITVREKHGALLDAELLSDVYIHLLGGPQDNLFMFEATAPAEAKRKAKISKNRKERKFPVAKEEESEHEVFLSSIDNTLWKKN